MKARKKILFFAPHSAIWVTAFPEALIAEALQREGHEIIYVTCSGQFKSYCTCMSAYKLTQDSSIKDKEKVCSDCNIHKNILKQELSLQGFDLSQVLTQSDLEEINKNLQIVDQENFLKLCIDGIEVGKIALYEFLLQYKKLSLVFSESEWLHACASILEREQPTQVIIYNTLYSVNHTCWQLARDRHIPTYFLHAGGNLYNRLETLWIGRDSTLNFCQSLKSYWPAYQNKPCSKASLEQITNHFIELLKGQSFLAYSSAKSDSQKDIRKIFGINDQQKILTATMSSYDERFAAETIGVLPSNYNLLFPKQVDWIQALIQFAQDRQDLFLIIRVHPREFPNKRESAKSEHAIMLEEILADTI
jgi:hypothetical protein